MASPRKIGKYELLKSMAVGGMAEIFLARQTGVEQFEKVVVIKQILPHLADQERFIQMFLDEARLAARFNHPNIVQIYDLGAEGDSFFIAMEFVHGEDLKSIVRRCAKLSRRIPIEHIVKIFSGVLDGLHYAHSHPDLDGRPAGVVHRDVSPHNVLVSFQGGVKLVDFGIAKARSEISTTLPGRVKGKHAYMSPEQCQGLELDGRSDIFSVGIVMYELITWTRLFKRQHDLDTLKAITSGTVRPPRDLNPELDEDLQNILLKALSRERDLRYQSAQEMQEALEDYLLTKSLKSNSVMLARFMSDLFSDKLAAMSKALEEAKAENLERAVLATGDKGPDLVEFLDMFFAGTGSGSEPSGGGSGSMEIPYGLEFTPARDSRPAAQKKKTTKKIQKAPTPAGQPAPGGGPMAAPPPKAPEGMSVKHRAPAPKQKPTRKITPLAAEPYAPQAPMAPAPVTPEPSPEIIDSTPIDPDAYREDLATPGGKGRGFLLLVFVVIAAITGGLIYAFHGTEQKSNAPKTGRVIIKSIPSGADVYVNDSRLPSLTPTEAGRIKPGVEHTLRVKMPGLPAWEEKFTLTDTTKPLIITATLSKEAAQKAKMSGKAVIAGLPGEGLGEIRVESKPPKALIYLDGVSTKRLTPYTLKKVPAGLDHLILLEKKGHQPAFTRLKLGDGDSTKVDLALEKGNENIPGRTMIHVESEPEGAKVIVNDYPLKKTTPVAVQLLTGRPSQLEIELKGYRTWKRSVRPVPGADLTFFTKLKKK